VALLPWLGLLQAFPHTHADTAIPQEELACSASSPRSHEVHLHEAGHLLPHYPCLACLAGMSHAAAPSLFKLEREEPAARFAAEQTHDVRSRSRAYLPLSRGPPVAV